MQGVPRALPIAAPMRRQAIPWSIQNRRIAAIGVGQGVAVGRQGVGEKGGVEVHADPPGLRPVDPVAGSARARARRARPSGRRSRRSWRGGSGDASRAGATSVLSRSAPKLVGRAGLAGIMAGDGQAAAELLARVLEPADVVALPAVERDRDRREPLEGRARRRRPIPRTAPAPARRPVPRSFPKRPWLRPAIRSERPVTTDPRQFCPNAAAVCQREHRLATALAIDHREQRRAGIASECTHGRS